MKRILEITINDVHSITPTSNVIINGELVERNKLNRYITKKYSKTVSEHIKYILGYVEMFNTKTLNRGCMVDLHRKWNGKGILLPDLYGYWSDSQDVCYRIYDDLSIHVVGVSKNGYGENTLFRPNMFKMTDEDAKKLTELWGNNSIESRIIKIRNFDSDEEHESILKDLVVVDEDEKAILLNKWMNMCVIPSEDILKYNYISVRYDIKYWVKEFLTKKKNY